MAAVVNKNAFTTATSNQYDEANGIMQKEKLRKLLKFALAKIKAHIASQSS